jgi:hypothetical protein
MSLDQPLSDAQIIAKATERRSPSLRAPGAAAAVATSVPAMPMPAGGAFALGIGEDPRYRGMNKTERRYAAHLDLLTAAGQVVWWAFEAIRLRCAVDCFWTADFLVMRAADRVLELIDVKGRKGDRYYAEEDAILKIRFVAAHYPFRVKIVWERTRDVWNEEYFSPAQPSPGGDGP